jgi:signal peptidase I
MKAVLGTCRNRRLKLVLAGTFLLSWMRIAWRVAGCVVVVQGESMLPNFHPNDYALTSPAPKKLKRGEVVVLDDGHQDCALKRVVGLPGETICLWHGQVFINRRLIREPYLERNTCTYSNQKLAVFILGPTEYFVMGDNRAISLDSRTYGPIGIEKVRRTVALPPTTPGVTFLPQMLPVSGSPLKAG